MFLAFSLMAVAIALMAAGFKWLVDSFEVDNPRNNWIWALVAVAVAITPNLFLVPMAIEKLPGLLGLAAGLASFALCSMAAVRLVYRVELRRALGLGLGIPTAFLMALALVGLFGAAGLPLFYDSPYLTTAVVGCISAVTLAVHRRNVRFARQIYQLTSWLAP